MGGRRAGDERGHPVEEHPEVEVGVRELPVRGEVAAGYGGRQRGEPLGIGTPDGGRGRETRLLLAAGSDVATRRGYVAPTLGVLDGAIQGAF